MHFRTILFVIFVKMSFERLPPMTETPGLLQGAVAVYANPGFLASHLDPSQQQRFSVHSQAKTITCQQYITPDLLF